ncbi:glutamate synthase large subunit [Nitratiruptor sp. YY09-18]|uniref:glutamate synthase large subunit n=1 Tax=Nitratiruptor sp. YY09-18 TaxID=2724901 RepID=UPI001916832D|nr:glutamate synthase large subunit [Nitratiruptor sp. YY09-18]BCD67799.1 glutamate synthase (NADPH) large chain [Nitratiruptor sp. YY09-18]
MDLLTSYKDNCGFGLLASIENKPSHQNVEDAITSLERMMHRGAIAADGKSGDGSGLLFSMPHKFFKKVAEQDGFVLPDLYAVAMVFYKDEKNLEVIKEYCIKNDLKVLHIRPVPINTEALGELAKQTLPNIVQIFVTPNSLIATKRFDALLYLTRREIEKALESDEDFYIPSFSSKTIAYKGLVMPTYIKMFYPDLQDEDFEASFALFHQRFSTNTLPKWKLAQPFRMIAHNGEINSVTANRYNVYAKCESIKSEVFSDEELERILPPLEPEASDSKSLDNFFEFLIVNGVEFFKAARALIPAPWQNAPHMDAELRAYYEYTSTCFEAWDGPAAVSLTDGRYIGCVLDRNGLRPAKYIITKDKRLIIASEYGILGVPEENIVERGRLQSGEMIALDLKYGIILKNEDINDYLKNSNPYSEWLNEHMVYLQEHIDAPFSNLNEYQIDDIVHKQRYYNYTHELIEQVIEPMIKEGKEAVGSMGDDTPMAAFSDKQRNFTDFFKQKFAQVTNPPIDPIREKIVMSLNTGFGEIHNILDEDPSHAIRLKAVSPILIKEKMDVLLSYGDPKHPRYQECYKNRIFSTSFEKDLKGSLEKLTDEIVRSVKEDGVRIIVLDDRELSPHKKTIPMAMVIGRLNKKLLDAKVRHLVSIVAATAEVQDSHSAAVMIAYGASAVYPYLLFATVYERLKKQNLTQFELKNRFKNVFNALNGGFLKIMSKMGISTIASYRNSALFDVLGLSEEIVNECFHGSVGLLPGLTYEDIEQRLERYHKDAFEIDIERHIFPLKVGGYYKYIDGSEYHDFNPNVVNKIHEVSITGNPNDYEQLKKMIHDRGYRFIRDFLEFHSDRKPVSIDQVEPVENIFKRFDSAAMSLGSISPEAHECIAEAMNTIGAKSNSGEGGEDEKRFGTIKNSKIKQVASGRFGVTPAYLRSAEEIQIKIAQGAKPGEGGQLPGHKVTALIAKLRHTMPGVTLISPPPHHDIYSIEDLAQLIFDLKQVNPDARVAVKLVSTAGVGTIATGVAKAYADKIIISGGDGGTGAAPLTSIKFAGNPWELGLTEAHNALKANHLREFVELQTDGGLKTGLDVVKAAIMGAESYAFGTGVLTIIGCKILRVCHLNRCTVGIATQNEFLREHYVGTVDRLINYFTLVAEDVRKILAELGYTRLEDIIGRVDLLRVVENELAKKFDFSSVLRRLDGVDTCQIPSNEPFDNNEFEKEVLKEVFPAIENPQQNVIVNKKISNINRSFGARISGEIAKYYGDAGLKDGAITINLAGVAGQSLGAFLINGVTINLVGAANDYVGKGMNGGKIVITSKLQHERFSLAGNTCLYGATGGTLFVAGEVGERFAVRNSGALAVVEGTGDHACEYMTGGIVVILGKTGINFGAGMTGGLSFVYDEDHTFIEKINQELIEARRIDIDDFDEARHYLKRLLRTFYDETGSQKAKDILDNFRMEIRNFWMVRPKELRKVPLNLEEGE